MKLFLPDPEIADDEGFSKNDIFGYKDFGVGLANLLEQVDDPLVMALDGPWGSGKSIFTKMWAGHLRNEGFPVIYFDAFANDYMEDAFLALAGEVVELAQDKKAKSLRKFKDKAKGVARTFVKHSANIGVKIATVNVLDAEDAKNIGGDIAKAASDLTDQTLGEILDGRKEEKKALIAFSEALENLVSELQKSDEKKPLVFIIDELDRCRPDFALDILERIKHVFSTKDVHFVLVTHLEQLANAVRVRYGPAIDAETYLQKFYQIVLNLPQGDEFTEDKAPHRNIVRHFEANSFTSARIPNMDRVVKVMNVLALQLQLPLRTLNRMYSQLVFAFFSGADLEDVRINLMLGLVIMRVRDIRLYERAKSGILTLEELDSVFDFSNWKGKSRSVGNSMRTHWRFAIGDTSLSLNSNEKMKIEFVDAGFSDPFVAPRIVAAAMEKLSS